ncbi:BMP family lipoprotein [Microtetraspora glauca]|uniref:BMP family ABC transporter substrate-binding protein n=1 Tax=Microtetraspora glauca TaxID=1996 RepID=A0ABV3G9D2_MICGL
MNTIGLPPFASSGSVHGSRRPLRLAAIAGLTLIGMGLAACGGKAPATAGAQSGQLRVGIFVDNAFGDGDFFDQAAKAEEPLKKDKGAVVKTYEGQLQAQNFAPMLQDAADANDLVFVLGFEAIDALVKVAKENPKTTFVFIDGAVDGPDVVSAQFRTAEGCFMAGALAATVNTAKGKDAAGFIGGVNAPVIKNCQSGYEQGVHQVVPDMKVAAQYVGSFVDPAKGREVAIALAKQGTYAVFPYAGLSGAGAFDAAKSGEDLAPIGVVTDKSNLARGKTPGSLEMGVDAVILRSTDSFKAGELTHGTKSSYGFAEGGWSMIYDNTLLTQEQRDSLQAIERKLVSGELKIA